MAKLAEFPVIRMVRAVFAGAASRQAVRAAAATRAPERLRLSLSEQWQRIAAVLVKSVGDAENAGRLQASAAQQLDLATYALYNLVDELTKVMQEPLGRGRARVLHLEPAVSAPRTPALAA